MRAIRLAAPAIAAVMLFAANVEAETLQLSPANPQPNAEELAQGLAVTYAYPPEVKSIRDAEHWLGGARKVGPPLSGLHYIDTRKGDKVMTSEKATRVAAEITGYVRFERAGAHKIEFFSNDGVSAELGGQEVAWYDGRHPCNSAGYQDVSVPEPGWYELKIIYFQRLETACLLMKWDGGEGGMAWAQDDVFAYRK
ncbi:hypothetical protein G5B40_17600 [Pikeienuella piscinae]|uniref:PA14 domain-containing protein n=1 Tax=Pikeienuella piscinae TaxID=2748098 RepID=A0A7L5C465_9RHOB|nr:hypothetical protein [Pikeienuella piscinae]QIE57094.1 hypothetical protein G5B40_17600 [Pikeienuella piscinae]